MVPVIGNEQFRTVGRAAEEVGVTVRTLHHYDQIGLVRPSERSPAGYRLYTPEDLQRLQHVVVYRRLGFALEEIAELVEEDTDVTVHLRRQRDSVTGRIGELNRLVALIDAALEDEMNNRQSDRGARGYAVSTTEMKRIWGDAFDDGYHAEARERWGDSEAWSQSEERTAGYTAEDWEGIKAETDEINERFAALMAEGVPAEDPRAMDVAEAHRALICERFYDCPRPMHAGIAEMYVSDPRFEQGYEEVAPGLARYVRDAVVANAAR